MEGFAGTVSAVPDLPQMVPALAKRRRVRRRAARIGRRLAGTRQARFTGSLHRRDIRSGKKGGRAVGKTKRGKGTKIMAVADAAGFPLALHVASASPHEVTLVEDTLDSTFTNELPRRLIGDKAYDSDKLDAKLEEDWGIEMIAPNRKKRAKTQDGRPLRRYRRRWKVERLFAWLQNFRRLVVRYEFHAENFLAMAQLGCIMILLRLIMR